MAFPTSLTDGQIYNNYKYNSTLDAWIRYPYYGLFEDYPGESAIDILNNNPKTQDRDGWYWILPPGLSTPFQIYCDMTTNGGGYMRFALNTRRWGNSQGFSTDPISSYGTRVDGGSSSAPLDTSTCGTNSPVSLTWQIDKSKDSLDTQTIDALNSVITDGYAPSYAAFDDDISAPEIKGCYNSNVVMLGDAGTASGRGDQVWSTVEMEVHTLNKIFTTGEYVGNSDLNGVNISLPVYWYFK